MFLVVPLILIPMILVVFVALVVPLALVVFHLVGCAGRLSTCV